MKNAYRLLTAFIAFFLIAGQLFPQNLNFDNYKKFLEDNKNMSPQSFYNMYPVGTYISNVKKVNTGVCFLDSVEFKYNLTGYEKELLKKHDFMVSERLSFTDFWSAYEDVFHKDLPVFISTDALLHAIHMSYDAMLKDIETYFIIPKLSDLLATLHGNIEVLKEKYADNPDMKVSLMDYDVYYTIARKLSGDFVQPVYPENASTVMEIMKMIDEKKAADYPLFSWTNKSLDFSQFTVRGHYTDTPELGRYFQTMIWLGRTELYLIPPQTSENKPTPEDVRRQIIDAMLILEGAEQTNSMKDINEIDALIRSLVGESDNVKVGHLRELLDELQFETESLLDFDNMDKFQETLAEKSYADQKILSQILWTDPFNTEKIKPASAFLLFGQRFIIDSYISGSVVFDKIDAKRMLPSCLDILFALGNNASADFLEPELEKFGYSKNLAALRYLVDSYGDEFWSESVYNNWLNSIRTLNTPDDAVRAHLPAFMQTAAWQQEKMNTQLASWAQLRHDNLLYAKQSYSGGISCSNPDAYLEPIPEFYLAVELLAKSASDKIDKTLIVPNGDEGMKYRKEKMLSYFETLGNTAHKLSVIAEKEINGSGLDDGEILFLRTVYSYEYVGCGEYDHQGWYSDLFYHEDDDAAKEDFVVADVHTAPTDEFGNPVGWVWHVGTGNMNLAVVTVENSKGEKTAYVGPVMSYLEHVSEGFKRLTDEEWETMYETPDASRPEFVDLYLAGSDGGPRSANPVSLPVLATGVEDGPAAKNAVKMSCQPNPFASQTTINFSIPSGLALNEASLSIYDAEGNLVETIMSGNLPARNFSARWDGTNSAGVKLPSGVYFCRIIVNGETYSCKMLLER